MKPTNETADVASQPQIAAAIAPPPQLPASPIAIVSQMGIGSAPGPARRAKPPVTKPSAMIAITDSNTRRSVRRRQKLPVIRFPAYSVPTRGLTLIVLGAAALLLGAGAAPARQAATRFVGNDAPNWSPDGKRIAF